MRRTPFAILCLGGAILSFNVAASAALVPSIARDFQVAPFIAARIVWVYMLAYGVGALIYGPLVRLFDPKDVHLFCYIFFSLANLTAALSKKMQILFAARLFMGIFGAAFIPIALILIGRHAQEKNRGRLIGAFFGFTFIASLLGLFLSGVISWRMIYLIPAITGFILCIHTYFYLPSYKQDRGSLKVEGRSRTINYLNLLRSSKVIYIFSYIFLVSLFYHGVQQWLSVYFDREFLFSQFIISMLITLTSLSGIFGEFLGGLSSDSLGRYRTINAGLILMIASVFLLIFRLPLAILAVIMVTWGLGWTFNHAGLSTLISDLPGEFLNEAASLNSSVRFIAGGAGVFLSGLLMQRSFRLGFSVFGVCLLTMLFLTQFKKGEYGYGSKR